MLMKGDFFMPNSNIENFIVGETPFKPEYDELIKKYPGRGSLKIQISAAKGAFPIKDVFVDVATITEGKRFSIYHDVTDSSGIVNEIVLPAGAASDSLSPATAGVDNAQYLVSAFHPDAKEIIDCPVVVYDRTETILPISLEPAPNGNGSGLGKEG